MPARPRRNPQYPTPKAVERLVDAARRAGIEVGGVELHRNGKIRILSIRASIKSEESLFDRLKREGKI